MSEQIVIFSHLFKKTHAILTFMNERVDKACRLVYLLMDFFVSVTRE